MNRALFTAGVLFSALSCVSHAQKNFISPPLVISDGSEQPNPGRAAPYPAAIRVAGLTGRISKVAVTLTGLKLPATCGLDLLLQAPGGQRLVMISDATPANCQPTAESDPKGITVILDDDAPSGLPDNNKPVPGGKYRPVSSAAAGILNFPKPGPGAITDPSEIPAPRGRATLAVFNGADPNGEWKLYAVNDIAAGSAGSLRSWTLTLWTTGAASAPTATTLTSDRNPSFTTAPGNVVTLSSEVVRGGAPVTGGTVTFMDAGQVLAAAIPVRDGRAVFSASFATEGSHLLTATYSGTAGTGSSTGRIVQLVNHHTVRSGNRFCNPGRIAIPNGPSTGDPAGAQANPYPSNIYVSGVPGKLTHLSVTLERLAHPYPDDIGIVLSGPNGARLDLFSDVGGGERHGTVAAPVTITLDDAAVESLLDQGPLVTGTFKPTAVNSGSGDRFPELDLSGLLFAAPYGNSTLGSAFNGSNPNGTWALYVIDDSGGNAGAIEGGWCLTLDAG